MRFWTDAARHAVQAINLSPSRTLRKNYCPKGVWRGTGVSYSDLKLFGVRHGDWRLLTGPQQKHKLSAKAWPCQHLYTLQDGDGWMLWDLTSQRVMKSRDVLFHGDTTHFQDWVQ